MQTISYIAEKFLQAIETERGLKRVPASPHLDVLGSARDRLDGAAMYVLRVDEITPLPEHLQQRWVHFRRRLLSRDAAGRPVEPGAGAYQPTIAQMSDAEAEEMLRELRSLHAAIDVLDRAQHERRH